MSNLPSFPQTNISFISNQDSALIYKPKVFKKKKLTPLVYYSSSLKNLKDLANQNLYGDDMEKISREMNSINDEIRIKNKEYEIMKKEYDIVEKENIIVLNLLNSLISECQEIEDPLEKRSKDINKEDKKNQLLINKLKSKYNSLKKELSHK